MIYRILAVEDQDDLREIARFALGGRRLRGAEGIAKAETELPDLVLIDIQLPVLDMTATAIQLAIAYDKIP